jgi:hypothetical protein
MTLAFTSSVAIENAAIVCAAVIAGACVDNTENGSI